MFAIAALAAANLFAALPDVKEIVLQAKPDSGHLQDVWYDGGKFLYWAHTKALYKTDLSGNVVKMHVTGINDRAGSLAILEDGTFLVGCLRPSDILPSQVRFHHLDRDFNLIKSHVLDNVPVKLGIEVLKRRGCDVYLNLYGVDKDRKSLGFDAIRLDANFREVARGKLGGATGLVFDGEFVWTGWTKLDEASNTYTSKIVRKPIQKWCVGSDNGR